MTEVENSVGCLLLLLAVATKAHIAFIFSVAILLVSGIATIGSLLSQLQSQVLLGSGLSKLHHHRQCGWSREAINSSLMIILLMME